MPHLYVIAGPNGAGKTTFAKEFLPHFAHCPEFVNADNIAKDLRPASPERAAVPAARKMLKRIKRLAAGKKDFGFETTLSGKAYRAYFKDLRKTGYKIHLFFLWLPDENLAIKRVKDRVSQGGHSIPEDVIRRRFTRGIRNLLTDYYVLLDEWVIFDNSGEVPTKLAFGAQGKKEIVESVLYHHLLQKAKMA